MSDDTPTESFETVGPPSAATTDRAASVLYVDFDSPWRDALARELTSEGARRAAEFDENTVPLRSLGASSWQDGDTFHGLLKVTTD